MASLLWAVLLVCLAVPCVKSVNVDASCASDDCTAANSYCDKSDNLCKCPTGSTKKQDKTACDIDAESIGGTCGSGCPNNGECSNANSKCVCLTNYVVDDADLTTCIVAQQKVGRTCTPGNTASGATFCGDPATTNLECPSGTTKCACKDGYEGSDGEDCVVAAKRVGRTCTPATATEDTKCGALATTHLECTGDTDTTCACKSGYSGSKGGTCSVKSGAVGLVGSLVTVVLAAILHVFTRH